MARLALLDEVMRPALAGTVQRIRSRRGGKLMNLFKVLLHSPAVAEGWLSLFTAIRQHGSLPAALREIAIIRVAVVNGADYQRQAHITQATHAGVSAAKLAAIADWPRSSAFDAAERAVLAYADAMTSRVHVDDAEFAAVRAHLGDRELVELTATIAAYNATSRLLVALQVDVESPESYG